MLLDGHKVWLRVFHTVDQFDAPEPETFDPAVIGLLDGDESRSIPLTPRQALFVEEYLVDANATQAALRAGFAPTAGAQLLTHPAVAAAIAISRAQRLTRVRMTQDQVLQELSLLSHSSIDHYVIDESGNVKASATAPMGAMRAIQSVTKKFTTKTDRDGNSYTTVEVVLKLWDKPSPLKLMGRHVGLFPDRVEHTGKDGGPIEMVSARSKELSEMSEEELLEQTRRLAELAQKVKPA